MKKIKILLLWLVLTNLLTSLQLVAQVDISLNPLLDLRTQKLNKWTDILISTYRDNQQIKSIIDDTDNSVYGQNNVYYGFDQLTNYYTAEISGDTYMVPGVGYVIQVRGNLPETTPDVRDRPEYFLGGNINTGTILVPVTANSFCLLGNPYKNYLDLDSFLLQPDNALKLTGPAILWSHNTLISAANINPQDPSPLRFSGNDFAMYNILGGVAAGRSLSSTGINTYSSSVVVPNGKICYGTGFFVK